MSDPGKPTDDKPTPGALLRQSAVYGVAALLSAGDAVKVAAKQVKTKVREMAAEAKAVDEGDTTRS